MTKRKLALIIVAAVLAAILIAVSVCAIIANSKNDGSNPTDDLANWMSMIEDDVPLRCVAIPGAHDAGTKGMPYFAATQDRDIADLLNCGTRYLDLRVSYSEGKLLIYHGPSKSVPVANVLDTVKTFLTEHPSETVILDFQHFEEKNREAQDAVLQSITDKLGADMLVTNDLGTARWFESEYMDRLTLESARGKAIVFWGREYDGALNNPYIFLRTDDNGNRDYSALHSYYDGSLHKKSSAAFIANALPQYLQRWQNASEKFNEGLFVLQGQLTDGLYVFGPKFREATHTDNMNEYLDGLKESDYLQYVNIVIRDFVTPSKNCRTLQLNLNKGTVKEDGIAAFEKMILDNMN